MGNAVLRREDPDLLTGSARFVGDMAPAGTLHLAFVRSTMAHALIGSVDSREALGVAGVVGVFTAGDLDIAAQPLFIMLPPELSRLPLTDKARYVGDPVAVVVAESPAAAADGAELVVVDNEPLPAVTDPFAALAPDSPIVFESHGSNQASELKLNAEADSLTGHDLVVSGRVVNHRMSAAPIEPSAVLAVPGVGNGGDGVTLWCTTQRPHDTRDVVAAALEEPSDRVRVIAPAVGGGFGAKGSAYPEFVVAAWLARRLGRPVRWVETRTENLTNMTQGRDHVHDLDLGLTRDGRFCWLRMRVTADVGAYPGIGALLPFFTMTMASGPYRIPAVDFESVSVITNKAPIFPFRGAGRPEATVSLERIVDLAAAELGMDPAELRRRNLLAPDEFPLTTPTGANMDSGDYARSLDLALEAAGYEDLRAEQALRRARGDRRLLGVGVSVYVEVTAGGLFQEFGSVTVESDGSVTARVGTAPQGQGHVTAFGQILGEVLGVAADQVRIICGDTAEVPTGQGTVASRSLQVGGSAVWTAANEVLDKARLLAASLLEADAADIVVAPGGLAVAGVPARAVSWAELAAAVETGDAETAGLAAEVDFDQGEATYPFGAHVAVVEIDSDTGDTRLLRHIAVDDCGRILNPMLVEGQVHGGVATGVSQALYEQSLYDGDGNPRNTNFADYSIPAASELPRFETHHTETPTPLNPLGAKGIGESGTIGSTPAVQSAVLDALAPLGVTHLDMPYTPQRVWRAIAAAESSDRGSR
ncbi:MAG: xanthine dehydrogenase family protein molybdopterin-binding subunit [Acidimicrobiaceae bacterium]|nr:xanthine dehydrogenase family protein molybdopterin-binding subunit [Acidimicrobiaceae bacterium]MYH77607.1 xanthine dehydrogenase family protein molybdopterin-binding subunit [Acidimicrobiaceae bacterium]